MLLRNDLTHSLLHERYEDFASNDTAKYLSHLTNDIKTVAVSGFNSVITLPEEIFTFVFAVAAAFFINYVVALTMLGLTLLIFIVPSFSISRSTARTCGCPTPSSNIPLRSNKPFSGSTS